MTGRERTAERRAALRIGLWVGAASILALAAGTAILVVLIVSRSQRLDDLAGRGPGEPAGSGGPAGIPNGDHVVVDVDFVLPWLLALSAIGVLLLALIAWFAARAALRPMAEAIELQRRFVSDAGHELRTPLTALSSRVQILERRHDRGEPLGPTMDRLRSDAAVLSDTLNDLLLLAETSSAPPGTCDPGAAATSACELLAPLAAEAGIALRAPHDGVLRVPLAEATLARLCVALVDNAIQHAPSGSTVTVTVAAEQDRSGRRTAVLRVADTGPGIDPATRDRVFERFSRGSETGRRRGFGLGLALVREAAERLGGRVGVERTGPDGTVMRLDLPAVPE
ncbi:MULTISPECIES: sensor histidine kinase [unclassified Leucobacter]|uniref:sensor histidine kinase n=1 Tax=unclassified Leucobacter TaxID=2621730 RepID=UPI000621AB2E|nr:HAMP domain-containing sensor histidine kinase [Leucobacter sp. Ag1]KKI19844.1 hypothetical protein XM48_09120 [Leucobacter sp. Ag1]